MPALIKILLRGKVQTRRAIGFITLVLVISAIHKTIIFGEKSAAWEKRAPSGSVKHLFPDDNVQRFFSFKGLITQIDSSYVILKVIPYKPCYNHSGNYGDYVWQYAANDILPDFSNVLMCATYSECKRIKNRKSKNSRILLYHPMANQFNDGLEDRFDALAKKMEGNKDVVLIVGVGIQLNLFRETDFIDINPGAQITNNVSNFKFTKPAKKFLNFLNTRQIPATFRGDITWQATKQSGYNYGVSLGCPSLLINPSINLGHSLAKKYELLKLRIGDRSLRIALNIHWAGPGWNSPKAMEMSFRILNTYPNSVVYVQTLREAKHLYENGIPMDRVRLFAHVDDWVKSLETMDVSIGVRIHGNMAALAAEIPVLVIAMDYRILELAERMYVPHITGVDKRLGTDFDVAQLVSDVNINPDAFDLNRCVTANSYRSLFSRYGIKVKKPIIKLGNSC